MKRALLALSLMLFAAGCSSSGRVEPEKIRIKTPEPISGADQTATADLLDRLSGPEKQALLSTLRACQVDRAYLRRLGATLRAGRP